LFREAMLERFEHALIILPDSLINLLQQVAFKEK
jgi:hypothetical protein